MPLGGRAIRPGPPGVWPENSPARRFAPPSLCTPTIRSVTAVLDDSGSATVAATSPGDTEVGDLLLAIHGNDFYALSNMPAPTITGSPTVNAVAAAVADGGTNAAHVKAYWAVANTPGANTVTVTETGAADEEKSMVLYVLSGADTTNPIVDADNATGSDAAHVAPALTASAAGHLMVIHVNAGSGDSTASYTFPASMTERYDATNGATYSHCGGTEVLTSAGDTGTRTITPDGSTIFGLVTLAVRCAGEAGGDATVTPEPIAVTTTLPAASVSVEVAPAVLAGTTTLPAPSVSVAAAPATLASVVALPAVTIITPDVTVTPAVLAAVVTLPDPPVSVAAAPTTVAAVASLPDPPVAVAVAPARITTTTTLPAASVSVAAAPAVLAATVAVRTVAISVAAAPAPVAVIVALPPASVGGDVNVSPATVAASTALPSPGVLVVVTPAVLALVTTMPAITVTVTALVTPDAIAVVLSLPSVFVSIGGGSVGNVHPPLSFGPGAVVVLVTDLDGTGHGSESVTGTTALPVTVGIAGGIS